MYTSHDSLSTVYGMMTFSLPDHDKVSNDPAWVEVKKLRAEYPEGPKAFDEYLINLMVS